ncbi:hypothetical protein [Burkholderia sp. ABCPW 14]|uniref:hypothetical protein n=1 Tax=Burkholderia sp. ABCPW 14 TaxID=1637860 RepID=UPI0018D21DED|nr:hypothetical protein [Burkholderia sp. ABCPW 14]
MLYELPRAPKPYWNIWSGVRVSARYTACGSGRDRFRSSLAMTILPSFTPACAAWKAAAQRAAANKEESALVRKNPIITPQSELNGELAKMPMSIIWGEPDWIISNN